MNFKKYQHVERLTNKVLLGMLDEKCYIFPKIDGTNGSVWSDGRNILAGSRNRQLTLESDNQGFYAKMLDEVLYDNLHRLLLENPHLIVYGEFLVPHTLKTYKENNWRKFHIFDIYDREKEIYLDYDKQKAYFDSYAIFDYIKPLYVSETYDDAMRYIESSLKTPLYVDSGLEEGVVIKSYNFRTRYNTQIWGKVLNETFLELADRKGKNPKAKSVDAFSEKFATSFVTKELVEKEIAKIENEKGFESKDIPRVLHTIANELISDELGDFILDNKIKQLSVNDYKHQILRAVKKWML